MLTLPDGYAATYSGERRQATVGSPVACRNLNVRSDVAPSKATDSSSAKGGACCTSATSASSFSMPRSATQSCCWDTRNNNNNNGRGTYTGWQRKKKQEGHEKTKRASSVAGFPSSLRLMHDYDCGWAQ